MNNDVNQARIVAEQDAETDVSKITMGSCRVLYKPHRTSHRLYLSADTSCLKGCSKNPRSIQCITLRHTKQRHVNLQLSYAAIGFAISCGLALLLFIAMFAMIGSIGGMPY